MQFYCAELLTHDNLRGLGDVAFARVLEMGVTAVGAHTTWRQKLADFTVWLHIAGHASCSLGGDDDGRVQDRALRMVHRICDRRGADPDISRRVVLEQPAFGQNRYDAD